MRKLVSAALGVSILGALALTAAAPLAGAQPSQAPSRPAFAHLTVGQPAPDFALKDIAGQTRRLSEFKGKVVVVEWTSPVCPFTAMKYKDGSMQRQQADAVRRGVVWLSVNTSGPGKPGFLTGPAAQDRLVKVKSKPTAFLFDDGTVGRRYGAKVTPSAYVIGKDGRLLYQGAVDDDVLAQGKAKVNYIHQALADIGAGKSVRTAETRPYGCAVEY